MTTVVLLVLALIWGALLVSWVRSRSVGTFSDSVGTFRRHLNVLERTTPIAVRPANRLGEGLARTRSPLGTRPVPARSLGAVRPVGYNPTYAAGYASGRTRPVAGNTAALRRRQAQKRRRDVFFALLAGTVGSLFLAVVTGVSAMWALQVIFDVMLGSYVALLVRLRNLAAERELKLRFMPAGRPASGPSRSSYDFGGAYGELELRRAAN